MKKPRMIAGALLPLVLTGPLVGCGADDAEDKVNADGTRVVTVGLAAPSFNTAGAYLALEEQLGRDHGITMELVSVGGAGPTNQVAAVRAGEFDISIAGTNAVIDAIAEGADLQIVAGITQLANNLILTKEAAAKTGVSPDAPIEDRIRALKGLTIATSPPGSSSFSILQDIVSNVGLDPDKDVKYAPLTDPSAVPAGLKNGRFDGSFFGIGSPEISLVEGFGVLWASLPRGDIDGFDDYVGVIAFCDSAYAKKNPDLVEAVQAAFADAESVIATDAEGAAKTLTGSVFSEMEPKVFDLNWTLIRGGYTPGALFTERNWDTFVELFDESSDKDYASLNYEDFVVEPARGE